MAMMTDRRIRHLPVFDADKLVGFISIGDLVKCRILEVQAEAEAMRQYIAS
jgi:signal-transduction protein with cAMP-binding, CBS, and nucleotidyltransferase domain